MSISMIEAQHPTTYGTALGTELLDSKCNTTLEYERTGPK